MLFVDLGISKMFYSSTIKPSYNLTIMMESVFSFLPSYFSIIFLTKGEFSKSVSLFLRSHRAKMVLAVTKQIAEF